MPSCTMYTGSVKRSIAALSLFILAILLVSATGEPSVEDRLARHRNLGKAFYENPTTQAEAVAEFRRALDLAPKSARERLNYGLALLRAGKTDQGIAELQAVQKQDPSLPHTWFNLGIAWKKSGEHQRALAQFQQMVRLAPEDAISHYNLGALFRLDGKLDEAIREFELAAKLDATLAAPHFQLYNLYRTSNRTEEAKRELATFQRLKKEQEGAAIPEDVEWNMYAEVLEEMVDHRPRLAPEPPSFAVRKLPGEATGVTPFDANGDGKPELLVWNRSGLQLQPGGPAAQISAMVGVTPGDFNNDGLADLCVLTASGPVLFVNQKGSLARHMAVLPQGRFSAAVWLDYDHDYDLDLVLLGAQSRLFRNAGSAGFEDKTADFPFVAAEAVAGQAFRVVADTKGFDLAVSYANRPGVLYRDRLQGNYVAEDLPLPAGAHRLQSADLNGDGYFDLVYSNGDDLAYLPNNHLTLAAPKGLAPAAGAYAIADLSNSGLPDIFAGPKVLRRADDGGFGSSPVESGTPACTSASSADLNGDAFPDIACIHDGALHVLTSQTRKAGNTVGVRLSGVRNLKLAEGAEVEVKAGPRYQKKQYTGLPLSFGVGDERIVDTVRITWPNGLIQNEVRQPVNKTYSYQEAQRLSGSCPMIWTWNGRQFQYITDVLGVAPLGASSGDGQYFPVDHDEYITIPEGALEARDGEFDIRITEELSEVAYLDVVRLIAVDVPRGTSVYTNDKFKAPPFPEHRLFGVNHKLSPVKARDGDGRDVLSKLTRRDETYPDRFWRELSGVAREHTLELDFGHSAAPDNRALLVLHGWVDWADGSTFLGAAQEKRGGLIAPYLQVKDTNGRWVTAIEDMGMPAGKPKTIVVDLTGKFLSSSREVRIVTNLCVYWDEIFLSHDTAPPEAVTREVPLRFASLHFRGFSPNQVHPKRLQPERFIYEGATPVSLWNPTPGRYTRFGPVGELIDDVDDRLVVMGSGDELRLRFDARALQPPASDHGRSWLLLVDGWAKDRDANTAHGQTTEPLPFHRMSRYPYGTHERFPDTPEHRGWQRDYLTRPALRLTRPLRPSSAIAANRQ